MSEPNNRYIVINGKAVAEIGDPCYLPRGTGVSFSHLRVKENINANREYNLVNSETGKISDSKKYHGCFNLPLAYEINNGIDNEFYLDV